MPVNVLFSAEPELWDDYRTPLISACAAAGVEIDLATSHAPQEVDYIVFAPSGPVKDFCPFTRCKGVLGLWAGVERIVGNDTLTQPLARMVDDSLTQGMVEWVVGHTLRYHLGMDAHIHGQDGVWRNTVIPPLARERPITILGLGQLGTAAGEALLALGFPVRGWSRHPKAHADIACYHGDAGLADALTDTAGVVLLLPDTPATENILNATTLALCARGVFVINPGRGPLIDDDALLAAVATGQVSAATLDVFRTEPLPPEHPFWANEKITVTPHIAASTRPSSAARVIAENIRRGEAGEPFLYLVDRKAGY